MGTRGAWGFVHNDVERITYNHFDSYFDGLGLDLLRWARNVEDWDKVRERVVNLHIVNDQDEPTAEEREQVATFTDSGVSTGTDWYSALRHTQGSPEATLDSGYMIDSSEFPTDSLFCEYAYVFDLDKGIFEVYVGFQKKTPTAGRWAGRPTPEEDNDHYARHVEWCKENGRDPWLPKTSEYKAVTLVEVWPLHDLPTDEKFIARLTDFED
jgi:hypothetical protein